MTARGRRALRRSRAPGRAASSASSPRWTPRRTASSRRGRRARATSSATSRAAAGTPLAEVEARRTGERLRRPGRALRQGDPRGREHAVGRGPFERFVRAAMQDALGVAAARRGGARARRRRRRRGDAREGRERRHRLRARSACRSRRSSIRSEILCHGLGAHAMFPNTRTVLDIGGQDTKAIQVDEQGIVTSFQMNDRCAAGCGRYLGYIADEMNLGLHELGPARADLDARRAHQLDLHGLRRRRAARAALARREARGHPRRAPPRDHPARDVAARALGRRPRRVHVHRRRRAATRRPSTRSATLVAGELRRR